jgi:Stress responsive A/B Barrel Domain
MDFVDRPSLAAYGPHPEHLPAAKLVRATFERIVVFDFEL